MSREMTCPEFLFELGEFVDELADDKDKWLMSIDAFKGVCSALKPLLEQQPQTSIKYIEKEFGFELPKLLFFLDLQLNTDYFLERKKEAYSPFKHTRIIYNLWKKYITDMDVSFQILESLDDEVSNGSINEQKYIEEMNSTARANDTFTRTDWVNTFMATHDDKNINVLCMNRDAILSMVNTLKNMDLM